MLTNRNLKVILGDEISKNILLNNVLAQGSFLSHRFFNFYISELPQGAGKRFCYADNIAILPFKILL